MIRLFAAIDVPPEIGEELKGRQTGVPGARWRDAESLHLTLAFYGEIPETAAAELDDALGEVRSAPFDLKLEGVGAFGEGRRLNAIWAGVAESEPLRVLAGRCEKAGRKAGVKMEARRYKPHVTLAYLRGGVDPEKVAAWIGDNNLLASSPWRVGGFSLYSSWRSIEGSRYDLERDFPLL